MKIVNLSPTVEMNRLPQLSFLHELAEKAGSTLLGPEELDGVTDFIRKLIS